MNKLYTTIVAIFLALSAHPASAEPTVFGLELGKTTEDEFRAMYKSKSAGTNKWNRGNMYEINPDQIDFEGIKKARVIFDQNGILHYFTATLPKHSFDYLKQILDEKYAVETSKQPRVGNKYVRYRDGKTRIVIDAPHLSFEMNLHYIRDEFRALYEAKSDAEQEQRENEDKTKF